MKELNLAMVLAIGMITPYSAMATDSVDEVTIRMMNMNEYSTDMVTRNIELPDMPIDQTEATGFTGKTVRSSVLNPEANGINDGNGTGSGAGEGKSSGHQETNLQDIIEEPDNEAEAGDLDRDRIQDHISDTTQHGFDTESGQEQQQNEIESEIENQLSPGNEAPENNQQSPGHQGPGSAG